MNIHEYQAKELLSICGLLVPRGSVAKTPDEAHKITVELGGKAVVKAQIHAGGRGKGGGVKLTNSPDESKDFAKKILNTRIVTPQTGSSGAIVEKVLVEEILEISSEFYVSVLSSGGGGVPAIIASAKGGMDIEEVSANEKEAIHIVEGDPLIGFSPYKLRQLADKLGLTDKKMKSQVVKLLSTLTQFALEKDCSLVEINPLILTKGGTLYVGDAKLAIEDDSLGRQPELIKLSDLGQLNELERLAKIADLAYVKLDGGQVGCMVNGAGLAMATMDMTLGVGALPANFLDIGGSAKQERIEEAFRIVVSDEDVKVVLVNLFAGIARSDVVAKGIVKAALETKTKVPIVVVMRGTNAKEGLKILKESGIRCETAYDLSSGAKATKDVLVSLGK